MSGRSNQWDLAVWRRRSWTLGCSGDAFWLVRRGRRASGGFRVGMVGVMGSAPLQTLEYYPCDNGLQPGSGGGTDSRTGTTHVAESTTGTATRDARLTRRAQDRKLPADERHRREDQ